MGMLGSVVLCPAGGALGLGTVGCKKSRCPRLTMAGPELSSAWAPGAPAIPRLSAATTNQGLNMSFETFQNGLDRKRRPAHDGVGRAVVHVHSIAVDDRATGKHDVPVEAAALIFGERLHDRHPRSAPAFGWVVRVKQ